MSLFYGTATSPGPPSENNYAAGDLWFNKERERHDGTKWQTILPTTVTALTPAAATSIDPTGADCFTLLPNQDATLNIAAPGNVLIPGQRLSLVVTTGTTAAYAQTFGSFFTSAGALSTASVSGKIFTVDFICDGTKYRELSRSAAM